MAEDLQQDHVAQAEVARNDGVVTPDEDVDAIDLPESKEEEVEEVSTPTESTGEISTQEEVNALAREMGWVPKNEFRGKKENWVSAAKYIRRGSDIQKSMSEHIQDQKREIRNLRNGFEDVRKHIEGSYKAENARLKKELAGLRVERKEAITEGDVEKVEAIEQQMVDINRTLRDKKPESSTNTSEVDPIFEKWHSENDWYLKDVEMTSYADSLADKYNGAPLQRVLKKIDDSMKDMFPDKFNVEGTRNNTEKLSEKKNIPSPVEGGTRKGGNRFSESQLTDGQRRSMRKFINMGIMTKAEYLTDIARERGLL